MTSGTLKVVKHYLKACPVSTQNMIGTKGINNVMTYDRKLKREFEYKSGVERVFDYENIGKYSGKIRRILDSVLNSEGVVIYIVNTSTGCIPLGLALEHVGFRRHGGGASSPMSLMKADQLKGINQLMHSQ